MSSSSEKARRGSPCLAARVSGSPNVGGIGWASFCLQNLLFEECCNCGYRSLFGAPYPWHWRWIPVLKCPTSSGKAADRPDEADKHDRGCVRWGEERAPDPAREFAPRVPFSLLSAPLAVFPAHQQIIGVGARHWCRHTHSSRAIRSLPRSSAPEPGGQSEGECFVGPQRATRRRFGGAVIVLMEFPCPLVGAVVA